MELSADDRANLIKKDLQSIVYYAQKALKANYLHDGFDDNLLRLDVAIDSYKNNKKAFEEGR